ncbi:MAG: hypothetical protein IAX21_01665 [Candidatus Bathyarchaeota archaeon]|nr:hypothetical protein [Candidatus Bathyarchaeum tardum]WNZ29604.1 MAG: hypothetical protein IAX21_01665 [Candidatus Bathyarchaeota archaeon]
MSLTEMREKIQRLEQEKAELSKEIKLLRQTAEGKAIALECEVAVLREEAEALKKLLETL